MATEAERRRRRRFRRRNRQPKADNRPKGQRKKAGQQPKKPKPKKPSGPRARPDYPVPAGNAGGGSGGSSGGGSSDSGLGDPYGDRPGGASGSASGGGGGPGGPSPQTGPPTSTTSGPEPSNYVTPSVGSSSSGGGAAARAARRERQREARVQRVIREARRNAAERERAQEQAEREREREAAAREREREERQREREEERERREKAREEPDGERDRPLRGPERPRRGKFGLKGPKPPQKPRQEPREPESEKPAQGPKAPEQKRVRPKKKRAPDKKGGVAVTALQKQGLVAEGKTKPLKRAERRAERRRTEGIATFRAAEDQEEIEEEAKKAEHHAKVRTGEIPSKRVKRRVGKVLERFREAGGFAPRGQQMSPEAEKLVERGLTPGTARQTIEAKIEERREERKGTQRFLRARERGREDLGHDLPKYTASVKFTEAAGAVRRAEKKAGHPISRKRAAEIVREKFVEERPAIQESRELAKRFGAIPEQRGKFWNRVEKAARFAPSKETRQEAKRLLANRRTYTMDVERGVVKRKEGELSFVMPKDVEGRSDKMIRQDIADAKNRSVGEFLTNGWENLKQVPHSLGDSVSLVWAAFNGGGEEEVRELYAGIEESDPIYGVVKGIVEGDSVAEIRDELEDRVYDNPIGAVEFVVPASIVRWAVNRAKYGKGAQSVTTARPPLRPEDRAKAGQQAARGPLGRVRQTSKERGGAKAEQAALVKEAKAEAKAAGTKDFSAVRPRQEGEIFQPYSRSSIIRTWQKGRETVQALRGRDPFAPVGRQAERLFRKRVDLAKRRASPASLQLGLMTAEELGETAMKSDRGVWPSRRDPTRTAGFGLLFAKVIRPESVQADLSDFIDNQVRLGVETGDPGGVHHRNVQHGLALAEDLGEDGKGGFLNDPEIQARAQRLREFQEQVLDSANQEVGLFRPETLEFGRSVSGPSGRGEIGYYEKGQHLDDGTEVETSGYYDRNGDPWKAPEDVVEIQRVTTDGSPERIYSFEQRALARHQMTKRERRAMRRGQMAARRAMRRKVKEYDPSPEGIAGRWFYHGSRQGLRDVDAITAFHDPIFGALNLVGRGVYLTSSPGIARGYAGEMNAKGVPAIHDPDMPDPDPNRAIYRVKVAPERIWDMEEAPSGKGLAAMREFVDDAGADVMGEAWKQRMHIKLDDAQKYGEPAFRTWVDILMDAHDTLARQSGFGQAQLSWRDLAPNLEHFSHRLSEDFDALTHYGGRLTERRGHQTVILLDPSQERPLSGPSGRPSVFQNRREVRRGDEDLPLIAMSDVPDRAAAVQARVLEEEQLGRRPFEAGERGGHIDPSAVRAAEPGSGLDLAGEAVGQLKGHFDDIDWGEENVRATFESAAERLGQVALRRHVFETSPMPGLHNQADATKAIDALNQSGQVQYVMVASGKGTEGRMPEGEGAPTFGRPPRKGELVYVMPEAATEMWKRMTRPPGRIRAPAEWLSQKFVSAVLPFSAPWHAGNQIDLLIRLAVAGVNPFTDRKLGDALEASMMALDPVRGRDGLAWLEGHFGSREGVISEANATNLLRPYKNQMAQSVAAFNKRWREDRVFNKVFLLHRGAQAGFDIGKKMEAPYVGMAKGRAARVLARDMGIVINDHVKLGQRLAEEMVTDPKLLEEFGRQTLRILGDYSRGPFMEQVLMNIYPFATWMREANRFVFGTFPLGHPVKFALAALAAHMSYDTAERLGLHEFGDKFLSELEGFMKYAIPVPGMPGWARPTGPFTAFGETSQLLDDPWSYLASRPLPYAQQVGAVATGHMFYDTFGELALREVTQGRLLQQLGFDVETPEVDLPGFDPPKNLPITEFTGDRSDAVIGELMESFIPGATQVYQLMLGGFPTQESTFLDPETRPGTEVPWWENRALNPFGRVVDLDAMPDPPKKKGEEEPTKEERLVAENQLQRGQIIYDGRGRKLRWNGEDFVVAGNPRGRHDGTRMGKGSEGEKRRERRKAAMAELEGNFGFLNGVDDRAIGAIIEASRKYDVPPEILSAIYGIETNYGALVDVTSDAGAIGHMQFMPDTWDAYGVDATGDGKADPYDVVDAMHSAANYLSASGASEDLRGAIYAYNHADWYVDEVLARSEEFRSKAWKQAGTGALHAENAQPDPPSPAAISKHIVRVEGDEDIKHLDPALQRALVELSRKSGEPVRIESGNRSRAEQAVLYQAYLNGTGNLAAPPGESNHEFGQAVDADLSESQYGLLNEVGLHQPVGGEPWHLELVTPGIGIGDSGTGGTGGGGYVTAARGAAPAVGGLPAIPPGEMTALGIDPVKAARRRVMRRLSAQMRSELTMMMLDGEISPLEYVQRITRR